ncbi:MAG: MFS transporter [Candidatus Dormibacteraeota bacterium]|nr:MFS transporter [Candidatus Dormibacteraeota bacterium]
MKPSGASPTYGALFATPGFKRLSAATVVARTGSAMLAVILVLFTLQRFHSAPLAGLVVFLSIVPGIAVSPIAGALLDRHRRMFLITSDYALAALSLVAITVLDATGHLPAVALLCIVGVGALTNPLSNSGTRSIFPVIVPRRLWERANAVDSAAYVVASIAGPALGGVLVTVAGPRVALLVAAAFYVAGLAALVGMADPYVERAPTGPLLRDALAGLAYTVHNRALRGLALTTSLSNVGYGVIDVAMPVLLLAHFHTSAATVGAMWAVMGGAGLVATVVTGRLNSEHRERWFVVVGCAGSAIALACLLVAGTAGGGVALVAVAMAAWGIGSGPFDIGLFSLRQRATAPAWMGRAFAVSMSLNFVGMPIGSAITGPIVDRSIAVAFAIGLGAQLAAAACAVITLSNHPSSVAGGGGSIGSAQGRQPVAGARSSPSAAQ